MAIVIKHTFIDVEVERDEGCTIGLHRSCSDGALMKMNTACSAGWRKQMTEDAQHDDDHLLDEKVAPVCATTEDTNEDINGQTLIRRNTSSSSTSCGSEVPSPTPVSRSVSSECWADYDQDDLDLGSWGSPASEGGSFRCLDLTSPGTEEAETRKIGRNNLRCGRGKRGGAAGRRSRAARDLAVGSPEAHHTMTGVCEETAEQQAEGEEGNTLMLQNLDGNILRSEVQAMLDDEGLAGEYDFLYVPIDFKTRVNLGYAIINFVTTDAAAAFRKAFDGRVAVNTPITGLDSLLQRYRNSPVMHPAVPDEYRPVVFRAGRRTDFPAPTCEVRLLRALSDSSDSRAER